MELVVRGRVGEVARLRPLGLAVAGTVEIGMAGIATVKCGGMELRVSSSIIGSSGALNRGEVLLILF